MNAPDSPPFTAAHAVDVLNRALAEDADAVSALVAARVPCNGALAADPTIQVGADPTVLCVRGDDRPAVVGLLGILNGIFGVRAVDGYGYIGARIDESGRVQRFEITDR